MVKKIYESPRSIISLFTLIVNNKPVTINFDPISIHMGSRTGTGSVFETTDENIQEALEKHPSFGRRYFLVGQDNVADEVKETTKEEKTEGLELKHITVSTPAEAREYLVENFGYAAKGLTRAERIEKAGKEHGIVFDYE